MNDIKSIMLGHSQVNIDLVVITPLKSTFCKLKTRLNIEEECTNCFFENSIFKLDERRKGLLVLAPEGIAAKDIIELFSDIDILFFGLAGSLRPEIEIGSFVEVKSVINEDKQAFSLITTEKYKEVKCGYSPCMLGTMAKKYCEISKSLDCDVVDMETVYCAQTAHERNNRFTSLLLISDIPNVINFWELSDEEQKKLKENRKAGIDIIINYIEAFRNRGQYERRDTY